jgi:hypothetical protein
MRYSTNTRKKSATRVNIIQYQHFQISQPRSIIHPIFPATSQNIVTWHLKTGIVEPETSNVRQRLGKRFRDNAQQWKYCWKRYFLLGPPRCYITSTQGQLSWWLRNRKWVEDWQFSFEEKSCKSAAVKRRLYVRCSYSETVKNPLQGYD